MAEEPNNMARERNLRPTGTEGMAQPRVQPVGKEPTPLSAGGGQLPPQEVPKAPLPDFFNKRLQPSTDIAVSNPASVSQPPLVESPAQIVVNRPPVQREVDHRVHDAVEAGLVHVPDRPRTHSRRSFLSLMGVGAGVAVGTAVEAKTGFLRGFLGLGKNKVIVPGVSSDGNPTVESTTVPATQAPTEVPATPAPTEVPVPVANPGEHGLYTSVDQMKNANPEQKIRLKKILEGSVSQIINDGSIVALREDILGRETCTELVANSKPVKCTSMKSAKLNTEDYKNASLLMDQVGEDDFKKLSANNGVAVYPAYDGDSTTVRKLNVGENPFWVYKYIGQPPVAGEGKQITHVANTGQGYILTYFPEGIMEMDIYSFDPIGNSLDQTETSVPATLIATGHGIITTPEAAKFNYDGRAPFTATSNNVDSIKASTQQFANIMVPDKSQGGKNSIMRADGEYLVVGSNGQPIPRTSK